MLENSVYAYPKLDGRFAAFAGLKFSFDPEQPAGSRVFNITDSDGRLFNFDREYNVALKYFISLGRDGYECLKDPSISYVRDETSAILVREMLLASLKRMEPGYEIDPAHEPRRQRRLKLTHSSVNSRSEGGYIKVAPRIEDRIVKATKPLESFIGYAGWNCGDEINLLKGAPGCEGFTEEDAKEGTKPVDKPKIVCCNLF